MNLAIKGHQTRGKEVIEILEMLGGINAIEHCGNNDNVAYYIKETYKNWINTSYPKNLDGYIIFTLEGFIEKYPYKVGDKVLLPEYESEVRIDNMIWDGFEILYSVFTDEVEWYSADELNNFNDTFITMEEKKTNQMIIVNRDIDEVEIVLGNNFELVNREGKYYAVRKKPKYPKTYEECCTILNLPHSELTIDVPLHYSPTLIYLTKLLICRDAYWKIAGEQMGLGKSLEPDTCQIAYSIGRDSNKISFCNDMFGGHFIFEFPTEEMRDSFYENFKELFERCK